MILFHGTTGKRAKKIFEDGAIRCDVERHYTRDKSGNGYTEQGYVYLSNEIMFAIYFANCCDIEDKSDELFIFKIEVEGSSIEPDYDEIRIQPNHDFIRKNYADDLDYSLNEFKSCRIGQDITFSDSKVSFLTIDKDKIDIRDLVAGAGYNFQDAKNNYNAIQKDFIMNARWKEIN